MPATEKKSLPIMMPKDLYDDFSRVAKSKGRSMASLVRQWVQEYTADPQMVYAVFANKDDSRLVPVFDQDFMEVLVRKALSDGLTFQGEVLTKLKRAENGKTKKEKKVKRRSAA